MYAPPPPYTMLNGPPQYYPPPRRRKTGDCAASCCRCICCFCCFFFILFLITFLSTLYFYHAYDPKIPSYHLDSITVKSFNINTNATLTTNIHASFMAKNPNRHLEFIYGDNSDLFVEYSDVKICTGKFPTFKQSRENTTYMQVDLTGESAFGPDLQRKFAEDQKNGRVPLMVRMKVPINVILGDITMREFRVSVNCSMVVDGLAPGKDSRIISKETVFAAEVGNDASR